MRKIFFITLLSLLSISSFAQYYYVDAKNKDILRASKDTDLSRHEIVVPQKVNGYNVYKCDFHNHTIFSDGRVVPDMRVREAWIDGMDVIAITEHIEYHPNDEKIAKYFSGHVDQNVEMKSNLLDYGSEWDGKLRIDLNISVDLARSAAKQFDILVIKGTEITRSSKTIGHYNALFTQDNNAVFDLDPMQSIRNAKAQGALVMHNHPGWRRTNLEFTEFEKQVYEAGLIDGIEIMNGSEFYPRAIDRADKYDLFMTSNTDIHYSTYDEYYANGEMRNMTLVFAEDKTEEAIRDALENHRTLAYSYGTLAGEEKLLKEYFNQSVSHKFIKVSKSKAKVELSNMTSFLYLIEVPDKNPIVLKPFSSIQISVSPKESLKFTVGNMWCDSQSHPSFEYKFN